MGFMGAPMARNLEAAGAEGTVSSRRHPPIVATRAFAESVQSEGGRFVDAPASGGAVDALYEDLVSRGEGGLDHSALYRLYDHGSG